MNIRRLLPDTDITIEGEHLDYSALVKAIESTGAVVHSIDQLAAGERITEPVKRERWISSRGSFGAIFQGSNVLAALDY